MTAVAGRPRIAPSRTPASATSLPAPRSVAHCRTVAPRCRHARTSFFREAMLAGVHRIILEVAS
jgi:hypothetical protein